MLIQLPRLVIFGWRSFISYWLRMLFCLQLSLNIDSESNARARFHYWGCATAAINPGPRWQTPLVGLLLAGLLRVLFNVLATNITTTGSDPWDWQQYSYHSFWMRVLGPLMCCWIGCLLYVLVVESIRLSKLSDIIVSLDLLDYHPYKPGVRQGLTNTLMVVGSAVVEWGIDFFLL